MVAQYELWLIGYGNQMPEKLFQRLEDFHARWLVIDVRASRRSWCRLYGPGLEWATKQRGHDYIWLPQLSRNEKGRFEDIEFGLKALEAKVRTSRLPVVLLCSERLSHDCHRLAIARLLSARFRSRADDLEVRRIG